MSTDILKPPDGATTRAIQTPQSKFSTNGFAHDFQRSSASTPGAAGPRDRSGSVMDDTCFGAIFRTTVF